MAHKKTSNKTANARRDKKAAQMVERPVQPEQVLEPIVTAEAETPARPVSSKLPGVFGLLRQSFSIIVHNKKLFLGMTAVYLVLTLLFVQGVNTGGLASSNGHLATAASVFTYMLSSTGGSSDGGSGVYQLVFILIMSLAYIWALRMRYAGERVRIRDAFYNGMTPLVPFVLVLLVLALQLLPLIVGTALYTSVQVNGVAVSGGERILWLLVLLASVLWSFYMLSSSVMALYVVSEPGMTPKKARKAAKALSRGRRWAMLGRVVFLPLALFVIFAIVMLPLLLFAHAAAPWVLFFLMLTVLLLVHSYLFALYKELRGAKAV